MFFHVGTPKGIDDLDRTSAMGLGKIRHKVRIVAIDDEGFPYSEILRRHEFNITELHDIVDIKSVEAYSIVLCDIKGVGKEFKSKYEGAHIIGQIKTFYPDKIVIAFTGQRFDPTYNDFFKMSDLVIKKDIDSDDWIEYLDQAIQWSTDPIHQWRRLRQYLFEHNVPTFTVVLLEDEFVRSFSDRSVKFPSPRLQAMLQDDVKSVLLGIAGNAIFKAIGG